METENETWIEKEIERRKKVREERRKLLPEKLNKLGEWLFSEDRDGEVWVINDMEAVLR